MTDKATKKFTLIRRPVDPTRKRYYLVDTDSRDGCGAFRIVNSKVFENKKYSDAPLLLWGGGSIEVREFAGMGPDGKDRYFGGWYGLPTLPAKPVLHIRSRPGKELDAYNFIQSPFISNRAKELLETVDPDAFEFMECEAYDLKKKALPPYWMMAVKRVVRSFDIKNSVVRGYGITRPIISEYAATLTKLYDVRMSPDLPDDYHAFFLVHYKRMPIFDEVVVDQWRANNFTGLFFNPLQPPSDDELKKANQFYFHEYYYEEYRNFEVESFAWGDLV